jgi:hypothetical protein
MKKLLLLLSTLIASTSLFSATLQYNINGRLTGATQVNVGGVFYDVEFRDGSFLNLYAGEINNLVFHNASEANAASDSLLNQVFIGVHDTDPRVRGCTDLASCHVLTAFDVSTDGVSTHYSVAVNNSDFNADYSYLNLSAWGMGSDTTYYPWAVQAVWSAPAPEVPLPSSAWLFGSALISFFAAIKKRNKVVC